VKLYTTNGCYSGRHCQYAWNDWKYFDSISYWGFTRRMLGP